MNGKLNRVDYNHLVGKRIKGCAVVDVISPVREDFLTGEQ